MRFLFTFVGGSGHFEPLVPFARAVAAADHLVAFGCGPSMVPTVKAAGFTVFTLGSGSASAPERLPLRPLDRAREDEEFRDRFVRRAAHQRAPLTLVLCREWQPDVLVCDETDFGGMVAAEVAGIPRATVLVMAAGSFVRAEVIGEALAELRAAHSLVPECGLQMLSRHLVLSPFPSSFRDPRYPLPATAHSFRSYGGSKTRPAKASTPVSLGAAWRPRYDQTVYFTLGTIFNMESGDLFTRVLAGLTSLPINLIVTVGQHIDPVEFGPQPAHVYIERFIPQAVVLPYCDLVVSHGGSGSIVGALAHGLPSVLIPMGADQPLNALRCAELGVGRVLDPVDATPEDVREAVAVVLREPAYRQAAGRLRDEIATLPEPAQAVPLLERLSVEK
jgi:UDP:flavonoid glycosyltransferase YjiC (YdhE family)